MADPIFGMAPQDLTGVLFIADVVSDQDPERECEVQIRIPQRMDGIPDAALPWARPRNLGYITAIPSKGEKVYVEFLGGSVYHPVYHGRPIAPNGAGVFMDDYPNTWGLSDGTNYVKINKKTNAIEMKSGSGAVFKFDPQNGLIEVPQGFKIVAGTDADIQCVNANIKADGVAKIDASVILLNS